jgi:hypothetical protein
LKSQPVKVFVLCVAGLMLIIRAFYYWFKHKQQQTWVETKAEVLSVKDVVDEKNSTYEDMAVCEEITVKFNHNGRELVTSAIYREGLNGGFSPYVVRSKFKPGWNVKIYYNPANEEEIVFINEETDYGIMLTFIAGAALMLIAVVLLVS